MALETEGKLDSQTLEQGIRELLTNEDQGFYLIAEDLDRKESCFAGNNYEWSDYEMDYSGNPKCLRRESGEKEFSQIYKAVKMRAKEANVCGVRLYVEQLNNIAQSTLLLSRNENSVSDVENRFQEGLNHKMCGRFAEILRWG